MEISLSYEEIEKSIYDFAGMRTRISYEKPNKIKVVVRKKLLFVTLPFKAGLEITEVSESGMAFKFDVFPGLDGAVRNILASVKRKYGVSDEALIVAGNMVRVEFSKINKAKRFFSHYELRDIVFEGERLVIFGSIV